MRGEEEGEGSKDALQDVDGLVKLVKCEACDGPSVSCGGGLVRSSSERGLEVFEFLVQESSVERQRGRRKRG